MKITLLLAYAGPDQVMVATSALATIVGVVLMVWNRFLVFCGKVINLFRRTPEPVTSESQPPRDAA